MEFFILYILYFRLSLTIGINIKLKPKIKFKRMLKFTHIFPLKIHLSGIEGSQ